MKAEAFNQSEDVVLMNDGSFKREEWIRDVYKRRCKQMHRFVMRCSLCVTINCWIWVFEIEP